MIYISAETLLTRPGPGATGQPPEAARVPQRPGTILRRVLKLLNDESDSKVCEMIQNVC